MRVASVVGGLLHKCCQRAQRGLPGVHRPSDLAGADAGHQADRRATAPLRALRRRTPSMGAGGISDEPRWALAMLSQTSRKHAAINLSWFASLSTRSASSSSRHKRRVGLAAPVAHVHSYKPAQRPRSLSGQGPLAATFWRRRAAKRCATRGACNAVTARVIASSMQRSYARCTSNDIHRR